MSNFGDPLWLRERSLALARLSRDSLGEAERQALGLLRHAASAAQQPPAVGPAASAEQTDVQSLHAKLEGLLDRALAQSTASSRHELYHRILDHLLPDEARILSALSDGSTYPLIHVLRRNRRGLPGDPLLLNACLVGKAANVSLPQLTPLYVAHLLATGLVDIGPEDPAMRDDYMILMADGQVLRALKAASLGPIAPPVERHTLLMSQLGHELWEAASGDGG